VIDCNYCQRQLSFRYILAQTFIKLAPSLQGSYKKESVMFKTPGKLLMVSAVAVAVMSSAPALAQHRHYDHRGGGGNWGLGWGLLLGSAIVLSASQPRPVYQAPPVYMAPPAYYPEPAYVAPYVYSPPAATVAAPSAQSWWYHCSNPEGYYPYVTACPPGWTRVSPTPQGN
jgi:hypothetical protein